MTWIGRDEQGRLTDFTAESTTSDSASPPNITVAGAQTVSLLGPFHVDHETVVLEATGNVVATIPANVLLLKALFIITEYWMDTFDADPATMGIKIESGADGLDLSIYDPTQQVVSDPTTFGGETAYADSQPFPLSTFTYAESQLKFYITTGGDPLESGAGDVYALIASPS
jgi:hypothetical protein